LPRDKRIEGIEDHETRALAPFLIAIAVLLDKVPMADQNTTLPGRNKVESPWGDDQPHLLPESLNKRLVVFPHNVSDKGDNSCGFYLPPEFLPGEN
jgi:hypothetical protein